MKDALIAVIALAAIMLYVELRITHLNVKNVQYEQVGVMQYDNNGDTLYFPVYRRLTK